MVTQLARAWGQRLIDPIARLLGRLGLSPNAVTLLGLLLTAIVSIIIALGHLRLGGILLVVTLGADAIDGSMARISHSITRFGAFLDSTLDRWAEVFIFLALVWHYLQVGEDGPAFVAAIAMAASLLVSYTRARAEGVGLVCKEGLLTRFERLVILILGLISGLTVLTLWIVAILATFTAAQRILVTWRADQVSK